MPKLSGKEWVAKFPKSNSLGDLKGSFATGAKNFVTALRAAGASVDIDTTYRPPQRAYLMHWAWQIAKKGVDPSTVPAMSGVDIDWVHKDDKGAVDLKESVKAAKEMVLAYGMAHNAVLLTRHEQGLAVDMDVSWSGELVLTDAKKNSVTIKSSPRDNDNKDLHAFAKKSYGVIKLTSDFPHWSSDGH